MNTKTKEELIIQWKKMRGEFFSLLKEDRKKFEKAYRSHPLYDSVVKHFDKSFMEVNQLAELEIDIFLDKN